MLQSNVDLVMAHLNAGGTFSTAPVSYNTIKKHGDKNPDWWKMALSIAIANGKLKGVKASAQRRRESTHCKNGHELSGDNLVIKKWRQYTTRGCKACNVARGKAGFKVTPEIKAAAIAHIEAGHSLTLITTKGSARLFAHSTLQRLRREDPSLNRLVLQKARETGRLAPILQAERRRSEVKRQEANDYYSIMGMIPQTLPSHVRDDIAHNVFEAMLCGSLLREEVRGRIKKFVTDHNRMFPTNFAKFGDARLVSLDEMMFEDGSTTRGDTISEGLWG